MLLGVNSTQKYSVSFHVVMDDNQGMLWLEVSEHDYADYWDKKRFEGNEYGRALGYFKQRQIALKEQYGV